MSRQYIEKVMPQINKFLIKMQIKKEVSIIKKSKN